MYYKNFICFFLIQIFEVSALNKMTPAAARDSLISLVTHYKLQKTQTLMEWMMFSNVLKRPENSNLQLADALKLLTDASPNLRFLVTAGLTMPTTSVECERGISAYNLIKSDSRSSMKIPTVDDQLIIYLRGPDLNNFDFNKAFERWYAAKDRRAFKSLKK